MTTATSPASKTLTGTQRDWLTKAGPILDVKSAAPSSLASAPSAPAGAGDKVGIAPAVIVPVIIGALKTLTGELKVTCELLNNTGKTLRIDPGSLGEPKHGEYKTNPPRELAKSGEFVAISTSTFGISVTETEGEIFYLLDEQGTKWRIYWDNPRNPLASNDAQSSVIGPNKALYKDPIAKQGPGADAKFTYELELVAGPVPPNPNPNPNPNPQPGPRPVDAASSCMITITNDTKVVLTLGGQGHERGDFMTFPAKTIQPGTNAQFISVETPNNQDPKDEGCKGFALYQVGSPDVLWRVEWDNPEQAKNVASALFNPPNPGFNSLNQIGQGEENVPVSFTISGGGGPVPPPPPPPPSTGTKLIFSVLAEEGNKPIEGAAVAVDGNPAKKTAANGKVDFPATPGSHPFSATADGFEENRGSAEVAPGKDTEQTLFMKKKNEPQAEFNPPPKSKQPTLRKGDKSEDGWVEYLQQSLNRHGFGPLDVDGKFGAGTDKAIRTFQEKNKLQVDGTAGNQTWAALREGTPENPSTDGREPHTFVEHGEEIRWIQEKDNCVYLPDDDLIQMFATSVGDKTIEKADVTVRVTPPNQPPKVITVPIAKSIEQSDPQGAHYTFVIEKFKARFPSPAKVEDYKLEAYFAAELGGDLYDAGIKTLTPE